jgi:beta-barrel assembly-enhancing protease
MAVSLAMAAVLAPGSVLAKDSKKNPSEIGERKVARGVNFYSVEQEIALGKQLAIEIEKQARIVDDSVVSEYINRLGQNLVRNSDVTFPVSFKLIESDEINAFTLPGGFIFVNTGLLKLSANEAELAAAMAHELGHSAARHATRQATRNQLVSLGTLPLAVLGGWGGLAARQAANVAMPMAFFRFSREFETEADLLGIQYLWKAGYDPDASIDLFEAMESTEHRRPGSVSKLFRSHPLTPDRIEKTQKNIDKLLPGRNEYVINTSEYESVRARLNDNSKQPRLRRAPAGTIESDTDPQDPVN